jgi:hypothetical protein
MYDPWMLMAYVLVGAGLSLIAWAWLLPDPYSSLARGIPKT